MKTCEDQKLLYMTRAVSKQFSLAYAVDVFATTLPDAVRRGKYPSHWFQTFREGIWTTLQK